MKTSYPIENRAMAKQDKTVILIHEKNDLDNDLLLKQKLPLSYILLQSSLQKIIQK